MDGFTTKQANVNFQQLANTPTQFSGDAQDLARSQRLAELLSSSKPAEGQMISGRYVAPSWTQHLNTLLQSGLGAYYGNKAEEQQTKLAEKLREDKMATLEGINEAIDKGDLKAARALASSRPEYGKDFIAPLIANAIPKPQEPKVVGNNLVDATGKVLFKAPKEYAPHAVQVIDTPNGMIQFDPNTRSITPVMMNGQQMLGSKSNLPEGATKQVTGATNLKDAIENYKTTLGGFNTLDMVNPDARAKMGNAYNNMMLQAKEAYNLGVLNGPDYQILQSVVKDPTKMNALLTSKDALQSQATDLSKQADNIIANVYKSHGRNVPASMMPKETPSKPEAPAKKGGIPAGVTPAEWNAMSDADKKLFQ